MSSGRRKILATVFLFAVAAVVAWLMLPRLVDALPGEIRGRLPEQFLELVTTPLPTALPLPLRPVGGADPEQLFPVTLSPAVTSALTAAPTSTSTSVPAVTLTSSSSITKPTATPLPTITLTPTATPLPTIVRLAGLEVTPQKYNNCGPANLSIVLNYYGRSFDQLEIGEALKPNYEDRNVSPDELAAFVRNETDLQVVVLFGLDLPVLRNLLAADFPVIIEKGLLLSQTQGWMGHYLTLTGYDEEQEVFLGLDTFLGPWDSSGRTFDYASLDELWAQFNRVAVIVYPGMRANDVLHILGAEKLDELDMWHSATEQARVRLATEPEDAFAWFDLGASLYHIAAIEGNEDLFAQSALAFDRAREIGLPWRTLWYRFEPYLAYIGAGRIHEVLALTEAVMTTSGGRNIEETYLYRGHALLVNGDLQGAERAFERALKLNPGLIEAQVALEALVEQKQSGQ